MDRRQLLATTASALALSGCLTRGTPDKQDQRAIQAADATTTATTTTATTASDTTTTTTTETTTSEPTTTETTTATTETTTATTETTTQTTTATTTETTTETTTATTTTMKPQVDVSSSYSIEDRVVSFSATASNPTSYTVRASMYGYIDFEDGDGVALGGDHAEIEPGGSWSYSWEYELREDEEFMRHRVKTTVDPAN